MFIPRGKTVYENLATSYVLVDALITDLCEGGFSGVVEITLRDTDAHIIIARGKIAAAIERTDRDGQQFLSSQARASVVDIASRSRRERGRVSVYSYPAEAAIAVAGRIDAIPLYTQLSTDFADLEKMIQKLSREQDRQWFIEVAHGGEAALVHVADDRCWVMTSGDHAGEQDSQNRSLKDNSSLRKLLAECSERGGTFDVYFKRAGEAVEFVEPPSAESATEPESQIAVEAPPPPAEKVEPPAEQIPAPVPSPAPQPSPAPDVSKALKEARDAFKSLSLSDFFLVGAEDATALSKPAPKDADEEDPVPAGSVELDEARREVSRTRGEWEEGETASQSAAAGASSPVATAPGDEPASTNEPAAKPVHEVRAGGDGDRASDAEVMAEVKRLMGEIARTIEEATKLVDQRESFQMYLRAGQLKVAERFPFLDPFGAEFEYLSGEIAFIGKVGPQEFVEGLTEALKLAVQGVAQSSAQGEKVRATITEELRWLLGRHQAELEAYAMDQAIERIIG